MNASTHDPLFVGDEAASLRAGTAGDKLNPKLSIAVRSKLYLTCSHTVSAESDAVCVDVRRKRMR